MTHIGEQAYQSLGETSTGLTVLSPGNVSVVGRPANTDRRVYFACKRVLDVVLALMFLLFVSPVMLVIACLIRMDSPGPILFRQVRVGLGGRRFVFYKFRTMYDGCDPEVHRKYVESLMRNPVPEDASVAQQGARLYKLCNDRRVTRIGHTLRRASLDELPQLVNVLKGEMSLVGPRPALPYEVNAYKEWHKGRLTTLPGMTGWWQVRGRCELTFDEMVRLDLEYIARQSLWFDLKILVRTVPAVISRRGAA